MKKRLLSAALALAMVLTLLPFSAMTAFAATPTTGAPITSADSTLTALTAHPTGLRYYAKGQLNADWGMTESGWYWADTWTTPNETVYHLVQTGVVSSGGTWFPDAATCVGSNGGYSFTLLANGDLSGSYLSIGTGTNVNLQVDLNGYELTLAAGVFGNVSTLTLTDPHLYDRVGTARAAKGKLTSAITRTQTGTTGFTLNATNVQLAGAISLTGNRNSVTLNNADVLTGGITLNGTTTTTSGITTTTTYVGQSLQASNGSTITGNITIIGDNNTISFDNTNAMATGSGLLIVKASGGNIQISNNSTMPTVQVQPHDNQDVATTLPSVTVSGSTVYGLLRVGDPANTTKGSGNKNANTFSVTSSTIGTDGIVTPFGTVSITSSTVTGPVSVDATNTSNGITLNGANLTGALTLGKSGLASTVALNVQGTNNTIGSTISKYATLNLTNPADPDNGNTWGAITDGTNQAINKITGGTFKNPVPANWLVVTGNDARAFELKVGSNYTYHSQAQLGDILTTQNKAAGNEIKYVPTKGKNQTQTITFVNDKEVLGTVKGVSYVPIVLPAKVADRGTPSWYYNKVSYPAGSTITTGTTSSVQIDAQLTSSDITKLTEVAVTTPNLRDSLRATLAQTGDGGTITLSGGVSATGATAITMDLTTDLVIKNGSSANAFVMSNVAVVYNSTSGAVTFSADNNFTDKGVTFEATSDGLTILRLSNGKKYSLANGGINVIQSDLKIPGVGGAPDTTGKEIIATVNISGLGQAGQKALKEKIEGTNSGARPGAFNWASSPAMVQALNAEAAKITAAQITQWKTAAQQAAWRTKYSSSATTAQLAGTGYDEVWLVPYLAMTVTQQSDSGTMTATLTPSFRVEVRQSSVHSGWMNVFTNLNRTNPTQYPFTDRYVAQQGRSLGELTGTFGRVIVRLGSSMTSVYKDTYMHQDGTYVYKSGTSSAVWEILNAGKTGLGSVVINKTENSVSMLQDGNWKLYDSLQAAVDQTKKQAEGSEDKITLKQSYTGSTTIDVTGEARTFKVKTEGNHSLTAANNNFTVSPTGTGKNWTVQLTKDTAVSTKGNITINSVTGGSASVSANPATVGQTVTVTLSANTGYTPSGVSVTNSSGQAVSVSGSGSTYTFTMPSGAVTVTPSFTAAQTTNPTVSVSNPSTGGTAATSAGTNRVAPGTTVTVTTTPGVGQRTMGLNVTGATAVRTGTNTFQFSVPAGYTNVVVTPRFDLNNGTLFEDVWSSEYYSNPVRWAVERGITNGVSTYRFGSENVCTREDMVTFLYRAAGSPAVGNVTNPFWDVQSGSYYYNAVMWAVSKGITNGVSNNQFGVGQYVTRGQAVTFLYRYAGSPAASTNSGFYDVNTREYYAKAVSWANANGVTNGTTASTFSPNDYCLRAQIVTFLYRDLTGNRA